MTEVKYCAHYYGRLTIVSLKGKQQRTGTSMGGHYAKHNEQRLRRKPNMLLKISSLNAFYSTNLRRSYAVRV